LKAEYSALGISLPHEAAGGGTSKSGRDLNYAKISGFGLSGLFGEPSTKAATTRKRWIFEKRAGNAFL